MKQKLFTFFLALIASVSAIYAQSGTCGDNLTWTLSNGTLTISGTGAMEDYYYYYSYTPWYDYHSSIRSVIINDGVTSIGYGAFAYCSSLTSVTIPESVTSIGEYAFRGCSSLTSITIPNSVTSIGDYAFYGCSSLTSINVDANNANYCSIDGVLFSKDKTTLIQYPIGNTRSEYIIPNSVTNIGNQAFSGCSSLTSVTIPESVTSIGESAFEDCSSLTSITIPESVTSIGYRAFSGCSALTSVTIPESVTSIGDRAFEDCSSLTSITIPESVTSIGYRAFSGCSSLTSVIIPNSVTSIGEDAFSNCDSLTSVTINSDAIVNKQYSHNSNLSHIFGSQVTEYVIGDNVIGIGESAFHDCSSLTSVTIPNSITSINDYAFGRCSSLTSITIPNSVTSIGAWAFSGCNNITSVTWNAKNCNTYNFGSKVTSFEFGNEVEVVPSSLCKGMEKLTSVTIPNSVKTIGSSAFEGCARLGKISLGTGLEEIAANAFAGCTRLYDIYVYATYPPFAEESSFANYNVYVYVPCEYQRDYTLDIVWGKFKFIECIDSEDATTDGNVTVVPGFNDVTITWPTAENADSYSLVINKDNQPFCTLTFNQEGQLLNIAFAPSRDGNNRPAQYAAQTISGYRFTVTGLTEATQYAYNITTKDADNNTIATYSGEFTTMGGTTTAVEDILHNTTNVQKLLRNGQLIIVRDGVEYNAMGQEL